MIAYENKTRRTRHILFLQFAAILVLSQSPLQLEPSRLPNQPQALVHRLYTDVVARHPIGIPGHADMKIFAPYLSNALLHRIDVTVACAADYDRRYPNPNLKPPFVWLEAGLFSGDDEEAEPRSFHVERTEPEKDGSFRVYVSLTWSAPLEKPFTWRVAAVVVREKGHLAVDDVIYLRHENREADGRLSQYLSAGCHGPRWVGFSNHQHNDQTDQK